MLCIFLLEIIIYSIWKMGTSLQLGVRLCFAPRLQEACALDAFTNIDLVSKQPYSCESPITDNSHEHSSYVPLTSLKDQA